MATEKRWLAWARVLSWLFLASGVAALGLFVFWAGDDQRAAGTAGPG